MAKIKIWLRAIRAPFLLASIIPVLVGTALAIREGIFNLLSLGCAFLIILSSHAGANLLNDYCDAKGSDAINQNWTQFSGGSRLIQLGLLREALYLRAAWIAFGISLNMALLMSLVHRNAIIFGLAVLGVIIGVCYSGSIICGMKRGWGELMVGTAFGPLPVMGSYLLQANHISPESFLAGIPVGFFVMGILILNEFPDVAADRLTGKKNWIVTLGIDRGVWAYLATVVMAYLAITVGVLIKVFPVHILYSYISVPLAVWVFLKLWRFHENVPEMVPAMAGNIGLHVLAGILLCIGLML